MTYGLNARPYRERRVRLSMWVRTRMPEKAAPKMPVSRTNVFMRIENEDGTFLLYDGNVSPIFGNTEWTRKFVVLEVPPDAYSISFGLAVTGPGEGGVDDVLLEDRGKARGPPKKLPMTPPGRMQKRSPEQIAQGREMPARRAADWKTRPAEVTNGDFETK